MLKTSSVVNRVNRSSDDVMVMAGGLLIITLFRLKVVILCFVLEISCLMNTCQSMINRTTKIA